MRRVAALSLLVLSCAAAPAWAQSSVGMFGLIDTYLDRSSTGTAHATRLQSGGIQGSRLGFRGSEDLGGGNKAIFLLEAGINVDDGGLGQGGLLFGRQAYAGLSTDVGDVTLGRHYSPYFFTLVTYGLGGGMAWGNASVYFTDQSPLRVNNSVSYTSPLMRGVRVRALWGAGENTSLPGGPGVGKMHSASVQYDQGRFSANVAYQARKTTQANTEHFYAAGASWQFGFAKLGVLAQARRDDIDAARNNQLEVSLLVPLGTGSLLVDVGRIENRSVADADARVLSLRYDYPLSKRTTVYTGAAWLRNEAGARFGINGNTGAALAVDPGQDPRSLIAGLRHTF